MALAVALVVTAVLAPVAAALARRLGIVDHPGPLKVQQRPVPYLGGLAVLAGLAVPLGREHPTFLVPLGLAAALGLADDIADLPPPLRLAAELGIGAATAAVAPGRGPLGALATVAFVVVLLNAVNLLDGLDGLASGVGAMSAFGFAVVLDGDARVLALALAGSLAGFLVWNRPPARIYLGDAGSYLVGAALALALAISLGRGEAVSVGSGALLLVAVPVADTTVAIVRRLRAGRPLFEGDRGHVYDQLVDRGWNPSAAAGACVGAQALLSGTGLGLAALPAGPAVGAAAAVVAAAGVAALVAFTSPRSWTS